MEQHASHESGFYLIQLCDVVARQHDPLQLIENRGFAAMPKSAERVPHTFLG
jgi:hypothetical protein